MTKYLHHGIIIKVVLFQILLTEKTNKIKIMEMNKMKKIVSIALVLMMVFALATATFSAEEAVQSPGKILTITVVPVGDGTATATPDKVELANPKENTPTVTLSATDGKDPFTKWDLHCEYDIISGDLNSKTLVIRPYTDITAYAVFGENKNVPGDKDATSPKTGYPVAMAAMAIVVAMGLGIFAVKKVSE